MATKIYLYDSASDTGVTDAKSAGFTQGAATSPNTLTAFTVAGPTAGIQFGSSVTWISPPLNAVTISGTVTFNAWAAEANMSANAGMQCKVERCDNAGSVLSTIVNSERGVEVAVTTRAVNNWTATPTSTALSDGDRLKFTWYANDAGGTMNAGINVIMAYNDDTPASDGDTWVQFDETVSIQTLLTQAAFRFYEDGTETGSSAIDAQNTNITRDVTTDSNLQLRIRLQETNAAAGNSTDDYQLYWSLNGGGYSSSFTGFTPLNVLNSTSLTNGDPTTNRLGSGSGSFVAGKISEDGVVDDLQITASNYTELLYSLKAQEANVADGDTIDLRVRRNGSTTSMTYTVTPRITVSKVSDDHTLVTQDIAVSLTEDADTINQNHVITAQDVQHSLSTDNTTISQNHVVAGQDVAIALAEDNTTVNHNHVLPVADVSISLTTDNTTIAQNHVIATADISFTMSTDNDTITQTNFVLTTQDLAIALATDNATIAQNHIIAGQDATVSLATDEATIAQTNFVLTAQDIAIGLTEDNATITQNHIIVAQDILNSLTEDNDTISQNHVVAAQDALVSLTSDNTTVVEDAPGEDIINSIDTAVSLSVDTTTISQNHVITTDDITFSIGTDNDTIVQTNVVLTVQDITTSLSVDADTITQNHALTPADLLISTRADNGYAYDGTIQSSRPYYIDASGNVYWVISQELGLVEKV